MAHIIIKLDGILGAPGDGTIQVNGIAMLPNSDNAQWNAFLDLGGGADAMNAAMRAAAVDAINTTFGPGTTGGEGDRITIIGRAFEL